MKYSWILLLCFSINLFAGSIFFDGTDDYSVIGGTAAYTGLDNIGTGAFTVMFWVKCHVLGADLGRDVITYKCGSSGYAWDIGITGFADGHTEIKNTMYDGTVVNLIAVISSHTYVNHWIHLAFVRDMNVGTSIYENGVQIATDTSATSQSGDMGSVSNVFIGASGYNDVGAPGGYLNASVGDYYIFDRALSQDEILRYIASEGISEDRMLIHFSFDANDPQESTKSLGTSKTNLINRIPSTGAIIHIEGPPIRILH